MSQRVSESTSDEADFPSVAELAAPFHEDLAAIGRFTRVVATAVPQPARRLLDHHEHMTVTVEAFHGEPVDVRVHHDRMEPGDRMEQGRYVREITLHRHGDGTPVQYGLVRMNFAFVADEVRVAIESRAIPLGRVLISHNVLRQVELVALWRIEAGPALARMLSAREGEPLYGRTALIHCDGQPAVELLEVLAPASQRERT